MPSVVLVVSGLEARPLEPCPPSIMLAHTLASALMFILFVYLFMPSVWHAIMAIDDYDYESGMAVVAARQSPLFSRIPTV